MRSSIPANLLALAMIASVPSVNAQRQMENLGRGVVAVRSSSTQAYVGWRLLGTDPEDMGFNLYRVRNGVTHLLNGSPLTTSCNLVDVPPNFDVTIEYYVRPVIGGAEQAASAPFLLSAGAPIRQYLSIPLSPPPDGVSPDGVPFTYNANDCSAGDVDGDGEYEIILKWDPSNSHDNSQSGFTGDTYLDCYRLDGTRLWRINLGPNIRSGAHYMDFMVFDFDGDGKSELMCRTAPGSRDGLGNYVGGAAKWQNANGPRPSFNNTDDYRFNNPNGVTNGYVLAGPEFLTVFNGLTGGELATATYYPKRDQDNDNDNPSASLINQIWGDGYGNRLDRFLAGVAYCDGLRPSAIFCRGYYTRTFLVAWDWRQGQLTRRWVFDSNDGTPGNTAYRGQGAHSLTIGDVDGDGKDEVTYGACAIDDDGTGLYTTRLGHGDAEHMSDMDPERPGIEVWMVHESPSSYGPTGLEFRDARDGSLIFGLDGQNADVGRGVAIDIDPRYPGYEMWGARGGMMNASGTQVWSSRPSQMNFACWWDADLLREILDGTTISKWNWNNNSSSSVLSPGGISSNNGTKATPCLSADLLGDWREEVIWRTSNNSELRLYTTTVLATNRFYTLMHDPQYRVAIAWQNTGYNQPPHPGFNIGPDMYPPPLAPASDAQLAWHGGSGGNAWDVATTSNWFVNGVWTSNRVSQFNVGDSVLFDLRGAGNTTINLMGAPSPSRVTVYSPVDYVFTGDGSLTGAGQLFKADAGTLTINNTNSHTGGTFVSGGRLFVNGSLLASPVLVEARGEVEGRARVGGRGLFGAGLTVQRDCGVIVGAGTNVPGTLTVTGTFSELGNVLNQFDLSDHPQGILKLNDAVVIDGDLTLTGTNVIEVTQMDGALGDGFYPLFTYTGTLMGGLPNLVLSVNGTQLQPLILTNPPGRIGLLAVIPENPPAAPGSLVANAIGAFQINLDWSDNSGDENEFVIERSTGNTNNFAVIASVEPDVTGYPDLGLSPGTTYYYRIRAMNLAGFSEYSNLGVAATTATPPSLTWVGDDSFNLWDVAATANWRNGGSVSLYGDGSFVTFDNSGSSSPAINLAGPLLPGSLTVNASKNYTFGGTGSIDGDTSLLKSGSGSLTLTTTNHFTGGTVINGGTVLPGSAIANGLALGSGPITFNGGTLQFAGYTGSTSPDYGGNSNPLIIPAGRTGTIRVPQRFLSPGLNGTLSGSGTLNLVVKYVRGDIRGNWTAFNGTINVLRGNGGSTVDDFRVASSSGFPNARLNVGENVLMYSRAPNGSVIPIGEFSASSGATISAGFGSSVGVQSAVTWRVGGLNTDASNAASFQGSISLIKEGSGTWTLTGDNSYTGTTTVNEGTLLVNGFNFGMGDVIVEGDGTLGGEGFIGGPATVNGRLAPGASIGTLSFGFDLTLAAGSTSLFEISKSPLEADLASVGGNLFYGGALSAVNTSASGLEAGDAFKLFDAPAYSGAFDSFDLPALDPGLAWVTSSLITNGTIRVVNVPQPVIEDIAVSGQNLVMSGSGGVPSGPIYLLSSTNLNLPVSQWARLLTNQFDQDGNFALTNPVSPGMPQSFFLLEMP